MVPVVGIVPATPTQAWGFIEGDFTLRHSLVAHEWATEHLRAWNAVFAEGSKRGNAAYYAPALVEMEIADADKRAEWSFQTCSEIWEIQGGVKCRAFFRAVFDWCLIPLFATRSACFEHEFDLHQTRTRRSIPQDRSTILRHFKMEMNHLHAKWKTKLEIETRNARYEERRREREALQSSAVLIQPSLSGSSPTVNRPKVGRKAERAPDFIALAGNLWKQKKGPNGRVSDDDLKTIGDALDSRKFNPPARYLEEKAAKELKARNSRKANSKSGGAIQTWDRLVRRGDKDDLKAMRKLLSRCASKQP